LLASLASLHTTARSDRSPRVARAALCQRGQTLAVLWLAAGIPLTLLMDIADPTPQNSFRIASHEAAQRPHGRDDASALDASPW
jgi:hypothetical protein